MTFTDTLQDAMEQVNELGIEELRSEAGHTVEYTDPLDGIRTAINNVRKEGFDPETVVVVMHTDLRSGLNRNVTGDPTTIDGYPIFNDVHINPDEMFVVSLRATINTPMGTMKPFLVEHPDGIVRLTEESDEILQKAEELLEMTTEVEEQVEDIKSGLEELRATRSSDPEPQG